jgi:hypothetical protein
MQCHAQRSLRQVQLKSLLAAVECSTDVCFCMNQIILILHQRRYYIATERHMATAQTICHSFLDLRLESQLESQRPWVP